MKKADGASLAALAALAAHLRRMKVPPPRAMAVAPGGLTPRFSSMQTDSELLMHSSVSPHSLYCGAMRLDGSTMANLELLEGADGGRKVPYTVHIIRAPCKHLHGALPWGPPSPRALPPSWLFTDCCPRVPGRDLCWNASTLA